MWPGILTSLLSQLPFLIASVVLCSLALWGWQRTAAPGTLLIAAGGAVQTLNQLFGIWTMAQFYGSHPPSYAVKMALVGTVRATGGMVAETLIIVGVVLLIRLLPVRSR